MTTEEEEIVNALAERWYVITNTKLKDYPPLHLAETIRTTKRMSANELSKFIGRMIKIYPDCGKYYHVSHYKELDVMCGTFRIWRAWKK